MPISREALQKIKEENNCDIFFETGFYKGEGVEHALSLGFEKAFSIELLQEFYDDGCKMFEKEISEGRVNLIADCSSKISNYIGDLVNNKVMFWFDAHIDNTGTPTTNHYFKQLNFPYVSILLCLGSCPAVIYRG